MSTNTSYKLTPNSQKLLVDFVRARYLSFGMQTARSRFEKIDQAVQLENAERRAIVKDYYSDTEISLVSEPVNTATSFLTGIYLQKPEVFEVVTKKKELQSAALQLQAINQENAKATGWERQIPLFFRDCTKYNFGAIEVTWHAEQSQVIGTNPIGAGAAASIDTVLREGNKITRRDPYNTFYDTSVPINEVHIRGEFAGYIERISMIDLAIRVKAMQVTGDNQGDNPVMNLESIFGQSLNGITNEYFEPNIRPEVQASKEGGNSLSGFFGLGNTGKLPNGDKSLALNRYECVTLYVRIIPSMFNMENIPGKADPQIWKLVILNWDTLIYAEKQTNAHNFFGLILNQVLEEGLQDQNKSIAEMLIPIQNLSTKIHDARMCGLKRNISDRAVYMQGAIDKGHVDNDDPTAKIPMRPSFMVKSARDAYFPIPYNDNLGTTVGAELGYLERLADKTSGTNAPQRGQFQKGNKTLGEFSEIMANADANMRAMALLLEASCMSPMKTIIMTNILQYSPPQEFTTSQEGETVQLDPVTLRKAKLEFKMADGLRTKESLLGVDGLNAFMNLLLQMPELNQKYDVAEVIPYVFSIEGINLKQFERSPEEAAARAQAETPQSQQPPQ